MSGFNSTMAIMSLQLRRLLSNRSACLTMLMLAVSGAWVGSIVPQQPANTCYVVYWKEDGWVQHLKSNLPKNDEVNIQVVPARKFTNAQGVISYPPGTQSIQIRPPSNQSKHWTVWCWCDRSPDELEPATKWFWRTSREYFGERLPIEVRTSSLLHAQHPLFSSLRKLMPQTRLGSGIAAMLLLLTVLFCAAYIQTAHMAEQIHDKVLPTILTKPVSLWRWTGTVGFFHVLLTSLIAAPAIVCTTWQASTIVICVATLLMAIGYCGLAVAVSFCSRSVANSTSLLLLYFLFSSLALATSLLFTGLPIGALSAEWSYLSILNGNATVLTWFTVTVWSLCCLAGAYFAARGWFFE